MAQVVLITGCNSGIGLALAVRLALDNNKYIVYATMRSIEKQGQLVTQVGQALNKTLFIKRLDVTVEEDITNVVNEIIQEQGRIDILVNNAGVCVIAPIEAVEMDVWRNLIEINFMGAFMLTRCVLPHMKRRRSGRIISVGSIDGVIAVPYDTTYCVSKFALEAMTLSLAVELQPFNIHASVIAPGLVATDMPTKAATSFSLEEAKKKYPLDELTCQNFEKLMNVWASMDDSSQPLHEVIDIIIKAMTDENPHMRYVSGKGIAELCQEKLVDHTGKSTIAAVNAFTQNVFKPNTN